jgi:hypothetical protein
MSTPGVMTMLLLANGVELPRAGRACSASPRHLLRRTRAHGASQHALRQHMRCRTDGVRLLA